jgi:hypothetical protein
MGELEGTTEDSIDVFLQMLEPDNAVTLKTVLVRRLEITVVPIHVHVPVKREFPHGRTEPLCDLSVVRIPNSRYPSKIIHDEIASYPPRRSMVRLNFFCAFNLSQQEFLRHPAGRVSLTNKHPLILMVNHRHRNAPQFRTKGLYRTQTDERRGVILPSRLEVESRNV